MSVGCSKPFNPEYHSPLQTAVLVDGVLHALTITSNQLDVLDSLDIVFSITNRSRQGKEFGFPQIPWFRFSLSKQSSGVVLVYPFITAPEWYSFSLPPGESQTYSIAHPFVDGEGKNIGPGEYTLHAGLYEDGAPTLTLKIWLSANHVGM